MVDMNDPIVLSEADYEGLQQVGGIPVGDTSIYVSKSAWGDITGTISNDYLRSTYEYDSDGILIEDLSNTKNIYKAVYASLVKRYAEKEEEWELLLKLNENNYLRTVQNIIQYLQDNGLEV